MSPLEQASVPAEVRVLRLALLVSGGIAAYKVADLVSQLTQAGTRVRVAMTASATRFVGEVTFQGLSGNPVQTSLWDGSGGPEPHVQLGDWAQLILVAPATANVVSKIARGQSDDLLTATVAAARCPVLVAPAMNDAMWAKPALQANLALLRSHGIGVVEPESGRLASGHTGTGRLASAQSIVDALAATARARFDLAGRTVLVSAGGTREPIDTVRFISNYSSGRMGYAVAAAAAERGARVILVSTADHPSHPGIEIRKVETGAEMLAALRVELAAASILVMAAAVADFRVAEPSPGKIRREGRESLELTLVKNVDILRELAAEAGAERVFRVGFAAEAADLEASAAEKLARKGLDAIVANDISRSDIAFGSEYNAGVVLFRDGTRVEIERVTKRVMADRLLDLFRERLR